MGVIVKLLKRFLFVFRQFEPINVLSASKRQPRQQVRLRTRTGATKLAIITVTTIQPITRTVTSTTAPIAKTKTRPLIITPVRKQ